VTTLLVENFKIAVAELRANPFRTSLTTLGIVIAVSAVIAVVSIVQGASQSMLDIFQSLGSNSIWVFPERPPGEAGRRLGRIELTVEDALAIAERCPSVAAVSAYTDINGSIFFRNVEAPTQVIGTLPSFQEVENWFVDQGRVFSQLDVERRANVIILGDEVVRKLGVSRDALLGESVKLRGHTFEVIGFLEHKGAFFGQSRDNRVVVPISTATKLWGSWRRKHVELQCMAKTAPETADAVDQITWLLRLRHRRRSGEPDDFGTFTQEQLVAWFKKFSLTVTALLSGIVSVALIVGGIGIMNIMLVSVSERTREIGVRKALGAKRKDVLVQFLVEAVTLGLFGGTIGIGLGYFAGVFAREIISIFIDFPPIHVPLWAVLLSFGFSGAVGLVSGLYPAWKAARLDPIEALRWE
jgi:putative ABC transport system permease protein